MKTKLYSLLLSFVLLSSLGIQFVFAQTGTTDDPGNAWSGIMGSDGKLAPGATDNGVQTVDGGSWFPTVPSPIADVLNAAGMGSQAQAQFHTWTGPDGNVVMQPANALTAIAMAANPQASGYNASDGVYSQGAFGGAGTSVLAAIANLLGGTGQTGGAAPVFTTEIAGAILSGSNAWTTLFTDQSAVNIFTNFTAQNWSPFMVAYKNACSSPAGCSGSPAALLIPNPKAPGTGPGSCPPTGCFLLPTPPAAISCPGPEVIQGKISISSNKMAPNYAIVVGQDPASRGVDVSYNVSISPTIYHTWERVTEHKTACSVAVGVGGSCPKAAEKEYVSGYHCEMHTQTFCESVIGNPIAEAHLQPSSRDWILTDLVNFYPGAQLKHPDWSWLEGNGGCAGSTYNWTMRKKNVQIEDPGYYGMMLRGATSGTPVSAGRSITGPSGEFDAYLLDVTIIK